MRTLKRLIYKFKVLLFNIGLRKEHPRSYRVREISCNLELDTEAFSEALERLSRDINADAGPYNLMTTKGIELLQENLRVEIEKRNKIIDQRVEQRLWEASKQLKECETCSWKAPSSCKICKQERPD